jgi:hypothetical protein
MSDVHELHLSEEQAQKMVEGLLDALCSLGLEHDDEPNQQGLQIEPLIDQFSRG